MELGGLFYNGTEFLNLKIPKKIVLEVAHTEPGLKGDTAKQALKPATLQTGVVVQVPLFVNVGDMIRVDTETQAYLERA